MAQFNKLYLPWEYIPSSAVSSYLDLKAFELRLTECVGFTQTKTRKWRSELIVYEWLCTLYYLYCRYMFILHVLDCELSVELFRALQMYVITPYNRVSSVSSPAEPLVYYLGVTFKCYSTISPMQTSCIGIYLKEHKFLRDAQLDTHTATFQLTSIPPPP